MALVDPKPFRRISALSKDKDPSSSVNAGPLLRWIGFLIGAAVIALQPDHTVGAADSGSTVMLHLPGISTSSMPFMIADDLGFYRDEAIRVETTRIRTGAGIQAMIAGAVDASQIVGPTVLAAVLGGAPLKIVMVFNDKPTFKLYVKSRFKSFADLKGAKIASSTPGSTNDRLLKIVLEKHGIDWRKDISIIYIGTSDVVFKALQAGSIDGAALTPPASFQAEQFGFYPLASFINEVGALQGGVSANEAFLRNRKILAEKFLRATLKGLRYFTSNREGAVKIMTKVMDLNAANAARVYDETIPAFVSDGTISGRFQDEVLDFELKTIGTDKKIPREKLFDFSAIRNAAAK
jgi:NitT/TauT family transport system substrate-binding protein